MSEIQTISADTWLANRPTATALDDDDQRVVLDGSVAKKIANGAAAEQTPPRIRVPYDSLQSAIDRAAADNGGTGGTVTCPANETISLTSDVEWPRNVRLTGNGKGGTLFSNTGAKLKLVGSGGGWNPELVNFYLDGIDVVVGETSDDYGNGLTIRKVESINAPTAGVTFAYNSWMTRLDDVRISQAPIGVLYDYSSVTQNSGANMVISNSAIFDCTTGVKQVDAASDGWDITISDSDIEHNEVAIELDGVGDGTLQINGSHFELGTVCYIRADSGTIIIPSMWMFGLDTDDANLAMFDLSGTARVKVTGGRISWSAEQLCKIVDTAELYIDPGAVVLPPVGVSFDSVSDPGTDDSTGGITLPRGYGISQVVATASSPQIPRSSSVTLVNLTAHDANTWEVEFVCVPSAAGADNNLRVYFNPGTGGGNINFPIPSTATSGHVRLLWTRTLVRGWATWDTGESTLQAAAWTHTIDDGRSIAAEITGGGSATARATNLTARVI